ncbi:MAG: phosphate signaling complex protein PhoU [Candidatus Desulfofervidaceae bacterium]|nr:phosphate signaling complex protein PhoU [Candidatus Desulfofervidaceae bacterium]
MLKERLNHLKELLLTEAALVENMLKKSIQGLMGKKIDILHEVIEEDEPMVNGLDIEIDKLSTQISALYQPEAKLLRTILMIIKINYDLERVGDHAVNIAQSAVDLLPYNFAEVEPIIRQTAEEALKMLQDSLNAFIHEDEKLARDICQRDDVVDDLRDECINRFVDLIKKRPEMSVVFAHLTRIVRSLERVADLATNIAENTIFVVKGEIVKHGQDERL